MNPLLLKYLPYLLAALAFAAVGAATTHALDQGPYHRLQDEYSTYKITVAQVERDAQKAAREALQAQITQADQQDAANAKIIADLNARADHAADDAHIARGLLNIARKARPTAISPVPETQDQPPTDAAPENAGDRAFIADFASAVGECRDALNQLRALQDEIRPQL